MHKVDGLEAIQFSCMWNHVVRERIHDYRSASLDRLVVLPKHRKQDRKDCALSSDRFNAPTIIGRVRPSFKSDESDHRQLSA